MITRQMPNGEVKQYADGTTEAEILADFEAMELTMREENKGLLADTSAPLRKNWLYDSIVVAPYEGVRKGLNSVSDLAEGIGDTLGDKFNVGGWKYGNNAENGIVEYVNYEDAKKDKNVHGLINPFSGYVGVKDASNIKGFYYDPSDPNNDNHTSTIPGNLVEGISQFMVGFKGIDKLFKLGKVADATTKLGKFGQITTKSAIADFTIFDENSGRLTDLLENYAPETVDTYLSYLKSDPTDTFWEGRLKNAIEGGGIGASADVLFRLARVLKNGITGKADAVQVKKDLEVINKYEETLETINSKVDQNTTLSEKMKMMNDLADAVNSGKQFKSVDTLTEAKKTQIIVDATSNGLKKNFEKWKKGELSSEEAFNIPETFINLKSYKDGLSFEGLKTFKTMFDTVHKFNKKLDKRITDEAVKRKAINEYGGDINRVFQTFSKLADNIDDTNALIFAHEVAYTSLMNAFPSFVRNYKSGIKGYTKKDMDLMFFMLENMGNNSKIVKSASGRNLRIYQVTKEEFANSKLVEEQILLAKDSYKNYGGGEKGFERFLDQVAIADNPTALRKILQLTFVNRTWNVLNEYWINALLSSPKTQMVNTMSNGIVMGLRPIEDIIGNKISQLISSGDHIKVQKFKEQYEEGVATLSGLTQFLGDATKYMRQAFKNGEQVLQKGDIEAGKLDTANKKSIRSDRTDGLGKTINTAGNIIRIPSKFLNAGDEWFKQINYRSKLRAISITEGKRLNLKGKKLQEFSDEYFKTQGFDESGTKGIHEEALKYAEENTFQNELVGITKRFQDMILANPFMKQFFPFVKTPFNIAKQIVDRTPVAGLTYNRRHILGTSGDPRLIAKARGQLAMGTVVLSSAYMLASQGIISNRTNYQGDGKTLDIFKDGEMVRQKKTDTNFKPYSIKFSNGYQLSFGQLDPIGAMFGIMADYVMLYDDMTEAERERMGLDMHTGLLNADDLSATQKFSAGASAMKGALQRNALSKTYLKSMTDIIEAFQSEDSYAMDRWISQKAGSFVPNIYKKFVNDPYIRDAIGLLDEVRNRTGMGNPSSPRYNSIGEPHMDKDNFAHRLVKNGLDIFGTTKMKSNVLTDEIMRLGKGLPNEKPVINNIDYKKFIKKEGGMTVSAWDRYNQILSITKNGSNRTLRQELEFMIKSDYYKTLSDPQKMGAGLTSGVDMTSKWGQLRIIQERFKTLAEREMKLQMTGFKSVDDERMTLDIASNNMDSNKITIKQPRLNNTKIKLKPIMIFAE